MRDSLVSAQTLKPAQGHAGNEARVLLPEQPALRGTSLRSPEFLLDDHGRPASLPSLATLLITPVILLDQHGRAPALLEFLLFIVTSEFALDKDGGLCHLFIKCILQGRQEEAEPVTRGATRVCVLWAYQGRKEEKLLFPLYYQILSSVLGLTADEAN